MTQLQNRDIYGDLADHVHYNRGARQQRSSAARCTSSRIRRPCRVGDSRHDDLARVPR
ncbi:hypothetical protein GS416_05710 [Rhodococcus hoagii]|nr:hypothetical protein [Prescottella equi]